MEGVIGVVQQSAGFLDLADFPEKKCILMQCKDTVLAPIYGST